MDLIGPLKKTSKDFQYILTVTDYFSKYVEAVPLEDKSAISVAKGIFKLYCRQGAPIHCICDQGKEFVNKVLILSCKIIIVLLQSHSLPALYILLTVLGFSLIINKTKSYYS